jgi:small subunit ribosomal protein S10
MRTHKRLVDVIGSTKETTSALENLELPAGVSIVMEVK